MFYFLKCQSAFPADQNIPFAVGTGVEGGFDIGEKKYDVEELCSVLVMPGWHEFPLSLPGLPEKVSFLEAY